MDCLITSLKNRYENRLISLDPRFLITSLKNSYTITQGIVLSIPENHRNRFMERASKAVLERRRRRNASAMLLRHCIISLSTQSAEQVHVWCRNCKAAAAKPGQQNPLSAASGQPQVPTAMHGPDPGIFDLHQGTPQAWLIQLIAAFFLCLFNLTRWAWNTKTVAAEYGQPLHCPTNLML